MWANEHMKCSYMGIEWEPIDIRVVSRAHVRPTARAKCSLPAEQVRNSNSAYHEHSANLLICTRVLLLWRHLQQLSNMSPQIVLMVVAAAALTLTWLKLNFLTVLGWSWFDNVTGGCLWIPWVRVGVCNVTWENCRFVYTIQQRLSYGLYGKLST